MGADFTSIALNQGYNTNFEGEWINPNGEIVAENNIVWNAIALPSVLNEYVNQERAQLPNQWNHSLVIGCPQQTDYIMLRWMQIQTVKKVSIILMKWMN